MSDGWQGILDQDETILWQGVPSARVRLEWKTPMNAFVAIFFTGFSVFWMVTAAQAGGVFWMFGLLFFGVGVFNLIGVHFWNAYQRRHTQYTLTSKRAFIGERTFGQRKLKSYFILPDTPITFEEGTQDGSIFFAERTKRTKNGSYTVPIGFEKIADARTVLGQISQLQKSLVDAR